MSKITVIGAGNVGATCAETIARRDLATEVVLLDIKPNLAEGKALDIWQTSSLAGFHHQIKGFTNNYDATAGSDVIVITSGVPRKPGMSREDLIGVNAGIVKSVTEAAMKASPNAIVIIVSNPLDVMTYVAFKTAQKVAGTTSNKVFGMAGTLDTARYKAFLAEEIGVTPQDIQALLLGGHGDTMVPLPRYTTVGGVPVTELVAADKLQAIIERTKVGGGELTNLLGTSAWYAPGTSAAYMVECIMKDQKRLVPVCAYLDGQYGQKDMYLGVPVILGRNGIEKVIELQLNAEEKALLDASAAAVKKTLGVLDTMNVL